MPVYTMILTKSESLYCGRECSLFGPSCRAFEFNRSTKVCSFFNAKVTAGELIDKAETEVWNLD